MPVLHRPTAVFLEGDELTFDALATSLAGATRDPAPTWLQHLLVRAFTALINTRLPDGYKLDTVQGALVGPLIGTWEPDLNELLGLLEGIFAAFCAMLPGSDHDTGAPKP